MTAFGLSPLGTALGPFGGAGLITVLGVLPASQNSFVVVFDRPPRRLDDQSPFSGVNPSNYALTTIDPTVIAGNGDAVVPEGFVVPTRQPSIVRALVDRVDPTQVTLTTDAALEAGVLYEVAIVGGIKSIDGDTFAGPNTARFFGRRAPGTPVGLERFEERFRDLDYVLVPDPSRPDAETQVYRFDDSGDVGLADNATSLRKRLFRRITTQPGQFAFLPKYGVGLQIKALARAGQLQQMSNLIAEQVKLEPDVLQAGASTSLRRTSKGGIVSVQLQIVQDDARERQFLFEFPS